MGGGGLAEIAYRHYHELRHFCRIVPLSRRDSVLELGCGTGRWAVALAPLVARWIGVDLSRRALELARASAAERAIGNVEFVEGTVPGFQATGPFHIAYFSGVTQYLDDASFERALDELRASLEPNAIIVDRSTINEKASENLVCGDHVVNYRSPADLDGQYARIGAHRVYRGRSYRFLRGARWLPRLGLDRAAAKLLDKTSPISYEALERIAAIADRLRPRKLDGLDRSHDFFLYRLS